MLTQLLPGLRELRAPVAAGYLWFLALWIAFEPDPGRLPAEPGVIGSLAQMAQTAGPVATGAGLTFLAYLVGSLTEGLWRLLPGSIYRAGGGTFFTNRPELLDDQMELAEVDAGRSELDDVEQWALRAGLWSLSSVLGARVQDRLRREPVTPSDTSLRNLGAYVEIRLDTGRQRLLAAGLDPSDRVPELGLTDDLVYAGNHESRHRYGGIAITATTELDLVLMRLIRADPAVHATVDRLRTESDVRFAIVPPLLGLSVLLAWESTPLWLGLAMPAVFLFRQGTRRRRESSDFVIDALVAGSVDAPVLERIDRSVEDALGDVAARNRDVPPSADGESRPANSTEAPVP